MSKFTRGLLLGAVFASSTACAYQFLLNDRAKRSIREAVVSIARSTEKISEYWEDLFGKGEGTGVTLEEHQRAVSESWERLGF